MIVEGTTRIARGGTRCCRGQGGSSAIRWRYEIFKASRPQHSTMTL